MLIRTETAADHEAVREVLIDAFEGPDEALLVYRLAAYDPAYRGKLVYPSAFHEANAIEP